MPLHDDIWAIVQPLLNQAPDALLFPARGGDFRSRRNWYRDSHWGTLGMGRHIHDLRHTAATLWLGQNVDLKTVQAWLGHASAKETADTYAHFMGSDADTAALARVNAGLSQETRLPGGAGGSLKAANSRAPSGGALAPPPRPPDRCAIRRNRDGAPGGRGLPRKV